MTDRSVGLWVKEIMSAAAVAGLVFALGFWFTLAAGGG